MGRDADAVEALTLAVARCGNDVERAHLEARRAGLSAAGGR